MHPIKISIFILCVLGILALSCWLWPAEGVTVVGHPIHWPQLAEVMEVAHPGEAPLMAVTDSTGQVTLVADSAALAQEELTPEQRIDQEIEEAKKVTVLTQSDKPDPIHLYLPNDSIGYLDNLFRALDQAQHQHVRIMHYGDSQLEEDRITSKLRTHLQEQFGGYGVGLLPAMSMTSKMTVKQNTYPELKYNLLFGPKRYRAADNRYGPMLEVCHVEGNATIEISPCKYTNYPHSKHFERVGVLAEGAGSIEIIASDSVFLLTADTISEMQQLVLDLPKPVTELDFIFRGTWQIYGLLLDGATGVSVDNIPMRGYAGTTFSMIDKSTMRPFFKEQNVAMIILQFGGNAVPGLKGDQSIENWKQGIGRQIEYFKRLAPDACILMIGPADMSTTINGTLQTYPQLPKIVRALREAANEHGAAFWSMYDAMGGWNSMLRWVEARPQLAGEDYIHFTHKGADKMADLLNQLISTHYENYKSRTHNDEPAYEPDSLTVAAVSDNL